MPSTPWTPDVVVNAVLNDSANLELVLSNYFKSFIARMGDYDIKLQDINSTDSLNDKVIQGIDDLEGMRKEFISVVEIFAPSKHELLSKYLPTFFENLLTFYGENGINLYTGTSVDVLRNDHYRFFNQFLFISLTSLLLENKCFDILAKILHARFRVFNRSYGKIFEKNFVHFQRYNYTLNQNLNAGGKRLSVTADYMLKYSDERKFDRLIKADILLYYISLWYHTDDILGSHWFPELSVYNRNVHVLPMMVSKAYFEQAKVLFGVNTVEEYKRLLKNTKETIDRGVAHRVPMLPDGLLYDTVATMD